MPCVKRWGCFWISLSLKIWMSLFIFVSKSDARVRIAFFSLSININKGTIFGSKLLRMIILFNRPLIIISLINFLALKSYSLQFRSRTTIALQWRVSIIISSIKVSILKWESEFFVYFVDLIENLNWCQTSPAAISSFPAFFDLPVFLTRSLVRKQFIKWRAFYVSSSLKFRRVQKFEQQIHTQSTCVCQECAKKVNLPNCDH